MSDSAQELGATGGVATKVATPLFPLITAMVMAVVLAVAALVSVTVWAARTGHLTIPTVTKEKSASDSSVPAKTKLIPLEPLLVNLADSDGHAYLRLTIALRVAETEDKEKQAVEKKDEKGKPSLNESDAALRDTALEVLGRQTAGDLLSATGKEMLKTKLQRAFGEHEPDAKVQEVLFTEFLVQR